jgi:hypothetical protein
MLLFYGIVVPYGDENGNQYHLFLFSSLHEPELPDNILPDGPVTYTLVEKGSNVAV